MDLGLTGKVAIITGGSKGLGLAAARALLAEGARVAICGRTAATLEQAAAALVTASGRPDDVLAAQADVSRAEDVERLVAQTASRFGGVDVLVNNVGLGKGGGLMDTPDDVWQQAFDQTLFPAIRASRQVVPLMQQRGGGVILLIASIWGRESGGRMTYNAVKAAEISLGKALAQQLAPSGIRVNSIAPGSILFEGGSWHQRQQSDPEGIAQFVARELPFGRFGRADEVGDVVAFLASPRASWISGACLTVDGCQSRSNI
ncbi:SDR family oxidoreductase [Luteitalea sp.]|uniref:SDR family NAD(P)-dependent oxidoreductase n=1 Tax=Luteitalea sp. TaxID=2004800 RepID=UPI0025B848E0|nr:SDR family oxidoreductase [Luteitalea sp.]